MKIQLATLLMFLMLIISGYATAQKEITNSKNSEASLHEKNSSSIRLNIPIYAQKVSIELPNLSWKPVFETQKPNYRIEFIPEDENPKDWQNLVSIQGFKGRVKNHYSSDLKSLPLLALSSFSLKELYIKYCPEEKFVFQVGGKVDINTKKYIGFIMGCLVPSRVEAEKTETNKAELGYYILIEGTEDLYLVHKALRGSESFLKQGFDTKNLKGFISAIEPIKLCKKTGHIAECQQ